jgi:hypothetical protein
LIVFVGATHGRGRRRVEDDRYARRVFEVLPVFPPSQLRGGPTIALLDNTANHTNKLIYAYVLCFDQNQRIPIEST